MPCCKEQLIFLLAELKCRRVCAMVYGHPLEPRLALEKQVKGPVSPSPQTHDPSWVGGAIWEHPNFPAVGLSTFLLHLGETEAQA